eukprot:5707776-Karenia_brevis.AAC.1
MSKAATYVLDEYVEPYYYTCIPPEQCGAAAGRGTDLATHVIRSAIDYATLCNLSIAILFIDLSKAFDYIIREIALGWPCIAHLDRVDLLVRVGLTPKRAEEVAHEIDTSGCIFEQLGAHPHIIRLLASLHTHSWFRFGNSEKYIVVERGGRQGCRFGGKIFNMVYAKVLGIIRQRLTDLGIILKVARLPGAAPWHCANKQATTTETPVVDITFVDDEAIIITASRPTSLKINISKVVQVVVEVFEDFAMHVNFKRGKTEALVCFRGPGTKKCKASIVDPN